MWAQHEGTWLPHLCHEGDYVLFGHTVGRWWHQEMQNLGVWLIQRDYGAQKYPCTDPAGVFLTWFCHFQVFFHTDQSPHDVSRPY